MAPDSFLPRIQSVFYAVFDVRLGPKIVYQVPEGLIAVPSHPPLHPSSGDSSSPHNVPTAPEHHVVPDLSTSYSDSKSPGLNPTLEETAIKIPPSSPSGRMSDVSPRTLFQFDDVSNCRIIGFPAELKGNYERNYFRYNVCFVFDRTADLSCYEPIVRKISRVLRSCEEESSFLSRPPAENAMSSILEQLYEDLNSYSETSIPIDRFNSIELKIFPFYPNPPQVKDWMVPLALINLSKRIEDNWDITMQRVCRHIDGTNHVSRIAHLADCDVSLARSAVSHLLYHQVIMTIDIFQYSNMYTLSKAVQWLADEAHVREECGPYVTRPGKSIPDWPTLLHLYSRLKPGLTVLEWMRSNDVASHQIDVRRFVSFGVIKGFLHRVHRWPLLLRHQASPLYADHSAHAASSPTAPTFMGSTFTASGPSSHSSSSWMDDHMRGRPLQAETGSAASSTLSSQPRRARKHSAAESALEQLRAKDGHVSGSTHGAPARHSREEPSVLFQTDNRLGARTVQELARPRFSAPASMPVAYQRPPPELISLLNGEHHTDELCSRFHVGWLTLEEWLNAVGGASGEHGRILNLLR